MKKKGVLVEILDPGKKEIKDESFNEFRLLVETLSFEIVAETSQTLRDVNYAYFIGKGKVEELKEIVKLAEADYVFIDSQLRYLQLRNLSKEIGVPCFDRPHLILMIFAMRAKTGEGKLQVELSELRMKLPEIVHDDINLDQQTASLIGLKGPGERKTELKKRYIEKRIQILEEKLDSIKKQREARRKRRLRSNIPIVAIAGYTNSGKSTLMNRLTDAGAYVENRLFATLDTLVRVGNVVGDYKVIFIDTIGFIRDLPHTLIYAFHSTLEEILDAWIAIILVDASDQDFNEKLNTVKETIKELGGENITQLIVFNKIDKISSEKLDTLKLQYKNALFISALSGKGIDELKASIRSILEKSFVQVKLFIPMSNINLIPEIFACARVISKDDQSDGVLLKVEGFSENINKYSRFIVK
ncbi:MAG: GTPase HflX [Caldisericum sp. CG2_30_36_11]|nr:MAG: GTPase HflX [Caldisericum sp. CG2_30_36_11]